MNNQYKSTIDIVPHKQVSVSLLSSEFSTTTNFRGFLNLGGVIITVTTFRQILENQNDYGILFSLPTVEDILINYMNIYCVGTFYLIIIPLMILGYFIELKLMPHASQFLISLIESLLILSILSVSPYMIVRFEVPMFPSMYFLGFTAVAAMKLYSFSDVMKETRRLHGTEYEGDSKSIVDKFPNVVSFQDYLMFLNYPTLCFQFTYPRSDRIRIIWLAKRTIEYILSFVALIVIAKQFIIPTLFNFVEILEKEKEKEPDQINYLILLECHLKIAIPNLYLWLILFFHGFQCYCNILAEITCFGDRTFYKDWWNSLTLSEYWRLWNLPVHNFMRRHIFLPLQYRGISKGMSMLAAFFVSAVGHEYMLSGSSRYLSLWGFLAMISQIPLIIIMDMFKNTLAKSNIGNCCFWVIFCIIGQPFALEIYFYHCAKDLGLNKLN